MQEFNTSARQAVVPSPIRISLERWGISNSELDRTLQALSTFDTRLAWGTHRLGEPADLVIHMVDLIGLAGPSKGAAWNLMGPVEALRAARAAGMPAIALVKGEAHHLPLLRAGCWAMSGPRDMISAARILAGAVIVGAQEEGNVRQRRLIELASLNATAVLHRIMATTASAIAATLDKLLDMAGERGYATPTHAYVGVGAGVPALQSGNHPRTIRVLASQPADTEADLLLAYPWPDLSDVE